MRQELYPYEYSMPQRAPYGWSATPSEKRCSVQRQKAMNKAVIQRDWERRELPVFLNIDSVQQLLRLPPQTDVQPLRAFAV